VSADLARLDATAQAELVRRGEVSAAELVDAAIARLEKVNPSIGAVIHPCLAKARARAAAKDLPTGRFRGVPFLMKDLGGPEAGEPYCGGMRALEEAGYRETEDGTLTQRFQAAGLISLGRTNTPELGLLPVTEPDAFGPTRSPWNLAHSSGGSSGGSAAAVAAGIVPMAHASDGGGSIRGPASMSGLVGLKPTRGRISFGPAVGERWSGFSVEFAVTRSVRDAASLLDAVAGPAPGDPYAAAPPERPYLDEIRTPPPKLRIGFLRRGPRGIETDPECAIAVERTAKLLESLGHAVEESHPGALDEVNSVMAYVDVVTANVARALDAWSDRLGRSLGEGDVEILTWALAQRGRQITAAGHLATIEYVQAFGRRLASWWTGGFDLLLTPTMGARPPEIGTLSSTPEEPLRAFFRSAPYGAFTFPFNMSGQPAISLPLYWTETGVKDLPLGLQFVALQGREDLLLRLAAQIEQAAPWASRRPPLHA
jgi:amidase